MGYQIQFSLIDIADQYQIKFQLIEQVDQFQLIIKQKELILNFGQNNFKNPKMFFKNSIVCALLINKQRVGISFNPNQINPKRVSNHLSTIKFYHSNSQSRSSPSKKPYQILGISRNASEKQIKTAYYKLAREYHPDVNTQTNAHSRFSEINTAYQHMINSIIQPNQQQKTSNQSSHQHKPSNQYTKNYQKAKQKKQKTGPFPNQDQSISEEDFNEFQKAFRSFINKGKIDPKHRSFSRFFSEFFTDTQNHDDNFVNEDHQTEDQYFMSSRDLKMVTINAKLSITPEQALKGITKNILYKKKVTCGSCFGKSSQNKKTKCRKCSGSGFVGRGLDDIRCCSACSGNGTVKNHGCKQCKGRGIVEIYAQEAVNVPSQAIHNQQIVLKGRGNQHPKKFYYGDIYIKLKISSKPLVRVEGMNTYSEVKLSISDAILGVKIEYPTLKGSRTYQVQKGLSQSEVILRGEGLRKGNKTGDHHLKLKIEIPKSINKKQEEIFLSLRQLQINKSKSSQ